jgi:serine/threonine protein kinase
MSLEAGAVLARSYRLLHTIGEGGMGRIWVADHVALDRRVAIKVLSDEAIQSQAALDLFHREARATARVDSPHVVRVLDYDVTDHGLPFLVLELLDGETLEERIERVGTLTLEDVRAVLEQTGHALAAAHDCGILHRDIKAENLFLQGNPSGRIDVRLLDFGIALTKHGPRVRLVGPVGTPQYMSPEQMLEHELDERSDLFSLAVCVYYALTGVFPFQGETVSDISCSLSRGLFVPVAQLRPGLPAQLDTWFERALAIGREHRFATAEEMTTAFLHASDTHRHDTPLTAEVDAVPMHYGWPTAVWKTLGVSAALACIVVVVHAEIVARGAARAHAPPEVDSLTMLTSAVILRAPVVPPAPSVTATSDAGPPRRR